MGKVRHGPVLRELLLAGHRDALKVLAGQGLEALRGGLGGARAHMGGREAYRADALHA